MDAHTAIVGVAQTPPVRRSPKDIRTLTIDAISAAIADAGLEPSDIDGIVTDATIMPTTVPHDFVSAQFGIKRRFDGGISYGGPGIVAAPALADQAIRSGQASTVLCYFGVDWGSRIGGPYAFHDLYPAKVAFEKPYGFAGQPSYFAIWAQRYRHEYGLQPEDLGQIAVNQRLNAQRNGHAQLREPLAMSDYLQSRYISEPLRVADCCLISDGACAFIVTSVERARDLRRPPVWILGGAFSADEAISSDDAFTQRSSLLSLPGAGESTRVALARAGLGIRDIDFAEIYDCFTISLLLHVEDMGFCGKGEGAAFMREMGTTIDGNLPINTHGGLLAHSYLLGAEHVVEAVIQLRGEAGNAQVPGARCGMVAGQGIPDYSVLILGRP